MADDPRYRIKLMLDTNLAVVADNLTKDDGATLLSYHVAYAGPNYPFERVFNDKGVDLLFMVEEPNSEPMMDTDQAPYGYEESVPIVVYCVDKSGITATKAKWKAEAELRGIVEDYAETVGSYHTMEKRDGFDQRFGATWCYGTRFTFNYRRDTTV